MIMTFASTIIASFISNIIPTIKNLFVRWGEGISRIVYGMIGVFVLFETGLIAKLVTLF